MTSISCKNLHSIYISLYSATLEGRREGTINHESLRLGLKSLDRVRGHKLSDAHVWRGVIGRVDDADLINSHKMASSPSGAIQEP